MRRARARGQQAADRIRDADAMLVALEHSEAAIRPLQELGHSPRAARGALRRAEGNSIRAANELTERAGRIAANRARPAAMAGEVAADGSLIDAESLSRVRRGAKRASERRGCALNGTEMTPTHRGRPRPVQSRRGDGVLIDLHTQVDPTALASLVSMGAEAGAAEDARGPPAATSTRRPRSC